MRDLDVPTHLRDGTRAQHARGGGGKASGGGEEVEKDRGARRCLAPRVIGVHDKARDIAGDGWRRDSDVEEVRHTDMLVPVVFII